MSLSVARQEANAYLKKACKDVTGRVLSPGGGLDRGEINYHGYRDVFPKADEFVGVDLKKGKGVDVVADIRDLPFKDESFDAILSMVVLEHIGEGWRKAIDEMDRVLKHQGLLFVVVPSLFSFHGHGQCNDYRRWFKDGISVDLESFCFIEDIRYIGMEKSFKKDKRLKYRGTFDEGYELIALTARKR